MAKRRSDVSIPGSELSPRDSAPKVIRVLPAQHHGPIITPHTWPQSVWMERM